MVSGLQLSVLKSLYDYDVVNGEIICRKVAKENVVFPTFFVLQIHDMH